MHRSILLITLLLLSTSVFAQKVKVQADKGYDYNKLKTYSWSQGTGARNPLVDRTIRDAIEQELAAKGLTKVESGGDVRVSYLAAVEFGVSIPQGSWGNTATSPIQSGIPVGPAAEYSEGTLAVDVIESASNNFIWRAFASKALDRPTMNMEKDAKRVEKPIRNAVSKMFKQFPRTAK